MKFRKYHGTGNDFLVVDALSGRPRGLDPSTVKKVCDRHFGVGGDGILLVERSPIAPWFMRVLNSDGTEAEMCGNGIRCVARFISDYMGHVGDTIPIDTPGGVKTCRLNREDNGLVRSVAVSMGAPRMDRPTIPMTGSGPTDSVEAFAHGRRFIGTGVNMGNPHFVVFEYLDAPQAEHFGSVLSGDSLFPEGANIEFAEQTGDNAFRLTVYERGCGLTLACGTGASATAVAAIRSGMAKVGVPIRIDLPGGQLEITVAPDMSDVILCGPAVEVFSGEIDLSSFQSEGVPDERK